MSDLAARTRSDELYEAVMGNFLVALTGFMLGGGLLWLGLDYLPITPGASTALFGNAVLFAIGFVAWTRRGGVGT